MAIERNPAGKAVELFVRARSKFWEYEPLNVVGVAIDMLAARMTAVSNKCGISWCLGFMVVGAFQACGKSSPMRAIKNDLRDNQTAKKQRSGKTKYYCPNVEEMDLVLILQVAHRAGSVFNKEISRQTLQACDKN
jgi:hypothetical protein